jgi:beta-glucuronidase
VLRRSILLLALLPVTAVLAEPLQNPHGRGGLSLDGAWRIIVDPYENGYYNYRYEEHENGYFRNEKPESPADLVEYDFARADTLTVPGDWNSQHDSLFFYEGTVWYQKDFELEKRVDRRYLLHFGAVNYSAIVYVNGNKVGTHEGGFTPFSFDVSSVLEDGDNFIVVKADNRRERNNVPTMNTDWWNYGGITRPVSLLEVPASYVRDYQLKPGDKPGEITVAVSLAGDKPLQDELLSLSIPELGVDSSTPIGGKSEMLLTVAAAPELWTPENPKLYEVRIGFNGETINDRVGFRHVSVNGGDILLNGKPVFLRGISLHEETPAGGSRASSRQDALQLLGWVKDLGANFVRLAHYPHNEHMLRVADEIGLLVWAEIPVYWTVNFADEGVYGKAETQLEEMILRDRNRASVILWSVANETPGSADRNRFLRQLIDRGRQLDSSRLFTAALDTQVDDGDVITINDPIGEFVDVLGVNSYCGWYAKRPAECAGQRWRSLLDKPVVISEFGAGALHGRHGPEDERWTEEYQASVYTNNLAMIDNMPFVRGMSPWILKDFRSPRRPLPDVQDYWNRKGLLSEAGERKQAWFVLHDYYLSKQVAGDTD